MNDNQKKVLEMLSQNKISVEEAYRLLSLVEEGDEKVENQTKTGTPLKEKPKYLRVTVVPDPEKEERSDVDRVNVKVPMSLIHAGIKFTSLIPTEAREKVNGALQEKGIDFDVKNVKPEDIEQLIEALSDLEVDVQSSQGEKVRVFVE